MSKYYIFIKDMCDDYKAHEDVKPYNPIVIEAESEEAAREIYLKTNEVDEEDAWLFYAADKTEVDKEEAALAETGYDNWDDYYRDLWPERPIEL